MIPPGLIVETKKVLLRPLNENDSAPFLELAQQDKDMWYYFSLNLADPAQLKNWMDAAFADKARMPFTIIDKQTGLIAGSSSLGNISYYDLRAEIGWSWLGKDFRSTGLNKHAKYALIKYVFEELNFERVEFKTDEENVRARKGLQHIGGREEGILRSHMTMWNNRRRSSIYYSILRNEWPEVKQTFFKGIEL